MPGLLESITDWWGQAADNDFTPDDLHRHLMAKLHPRDAKQFYKDVAKAYPTTAAYRAEKAAAMRQLRQERLDKEAQS